MWILKKQSLFAAGIVASMVISLASNASCGDLVPITDRVTPIETNASSSTTTTTVSEPPDFEDCSNFEGWIDKNILYNPDYQPSDYDLNMLAYCSLG